MKAPAKIILLIFITCISTYAQVSTFQDSLLDRMTGNWILKGTIAGQETTHDVTVEWILGQQYIQLREIFREKNEADLPAYEALVLIGWDSQLNKYACMWFDVTGGGGLNGKAIAHAERKGNEIPFLFKIDRSVFHTTFVYDKVTDTWQWFMYGEENGNLQPFARVMLTRKI